MSSGFVLGAKSKVELKGVHPDLVAVVRRALELTTVDFAVHDGLRRPEEQQRLRAAGASTTLNSRHLVGSDGFGHAVDLVPYVNGKMRWEWPLSYRIAAAVHRAASELAVDVRWGGVWDRKLLELDPRRLEAAVADYGARRRAAGARRVFIDGPHFELPKGKRYP